MYTFVFGKILGECWLMACKIHKKCVGWYHKLVFVKVFGPRNDLGHKHPQFNKRLPHIEQQILYGDSFTN